MLDALAPPGEAAGNAGQGGEAEGDDRHPRPQVERGAGVAAGGAGRETGSTWCGKSSLPPSPCPPTTLLALLSILNTMTPGKQTAVLSKLNKNI